MKTTILLLAILLLVSCSKDDVLRLEEYGNVSFKGTIPQEKSISLTSKIAPCTDKVPVKLSYDLLDKNGYSRQAIVPAHVENGIVVSDSIAQFPFGPATVRGIYLLSVDNDTLYNLPSVEDYDFYDYANRIVPFDINVTANTLITGRALCYTPTEYPEEGGVSGGISTQRTMSVWADIVSPCITEVTVEITGYRVKEIEIYETGDIEIVVPSNYGIMNIRSYVDGIGSNGELQKILFQSYTDFTQARPYTGQMLIFDKECELGN